MGANHGAGRILVGMVAAGLLAGCAAGAPAATSVPTTPQASAPPLATTSPSPAPTATAPPAATATPAAAATAPTTPAPSPDPTPAASVAWTAFTSKWNNVDISYPPDWKPFPARTRAECDEFDSPDSYAYLLVCQMPVVGASSTKEALNLLIQHVVKTKPSDVTAYRVDRVSNAKMGGVAARRILIHATYEGVREHWVKIYAVKGDSAYKVWLVDDAGHEAADLALANEFASTLVIHK